MRGSRGHVLIGKRHADAGAPDMRGVGPRCGDRPSQLLGQLGVQRPEAAAERDDRRSRLEHVSRCGIGMQDAGIFSDDDDSNRKFVERRPERLSQIGFDCQIGRRGLLREVLRLSPHPMFRDRHRPSPQTPLSSGLSHRSKFGRLRCIRGSSMPSRNPVVAFATRQTERREPRRSDRASPWSDTGVASMLSRNVGDHGPRLGVMPSHLPPIGLPCGLFVMSLRWRLDYCDPA